jgi:hypothetical protein
LLSELESGRLSYASDVGYQPEYAELSSRNVLQLPTFTGYRTYDTAEVASDVVTRSMINLLTTGADTWVVNPEFALARV